MKHFSLGLSEAQLRGEFKLLNPKVRQAVEPITGEILSVKKIEARREHTLHSWPQRA